MSSRIHATLRRRLWHLMMLLGASIIAGAPAHAVLSSNYNFTTSTGTFTPLTTGNVVIAGSNGGGVGTFNDLATAGPFTIGFNFVFDCVTYTQFTVNPSGMLILGTATSNSYNDDLTASGGYPVIAPFWQHAHMYDAGGTAAGCTITPTVGVSYAVSGAAPNRILTVDWHTQLCDANNQYWWAGCGAPMNTFQLRLFETSNKIEFQYGSLWASSGQPTSASIGIAGGSSNYMSVTPSGGSSATSSSSINNNNIRTDLTPVNSGTIYTFTPCQFQITGLTGPGNGGTAQMVAGDTLLRADSVPTGNFVTRTPYTFSLSGSGCTNKAYTMTISGPAAADYVFVSSGNQGLSGTLNSGGSITPQIKFTPSAGGKRIAALAINDGCSTTNYVLYSFGARPELAFRIGNQLLDSTSSVFGGQTTCIAESPLTYQLDILNVGGVPTNINGFALYQIDTTYAQGHSPYPFIRDGSGRIVPATDYIITSQPFVLPVSSNPPVTFPIIVPVAGSRLYLTFLPTTPGKRSVQLYIKTDAQNIAVTDTGGVLRQGWTRFGLFGRGVGSILSDNVNQGRPRAVTFPTTRIGDSSDGKMIVFNAGQCQMRISRNSLDVVTGDVDEFSIIGLPSHSIDQVTGDALIAPGSTDTLLVRFKPHQLGSRRASVRLVTNDSTVIVPGVTERGSYYADLFGTGKADLYASDVDFGTALIGGAGSDLVHRNVHLKNTLNGPIIITKVLFDGTDITEFTKETAPLWPKLPIFLNGGDELDLGVIFGPIAGGAAGSRSAALKMITANGDTITSHLTGMAGTRTVAVTPTSINFGTVTAGKLLRRTISITSTGTMPLTLQGPLLSPGSNFTMGSLPRLVLAPGQTEYLEVTYAPLSSGSETATLTVGSNSTGGPVQVSLTATAVKTKRLDVDPSQTALGGANDNVGTVIHPGAAEQLNLSGVTGEELAAGMRLWQSVPNPARDQVEIRYSIAKGADVALELYDAAGRLVKVLDAGTHGAGEQRVMVDVRDLASGVYHYRLTANGVSVSKTMTVAR